MNFFYMIKFHFHKLNCLLILPSSKTLWHGNGFQLMKNLNPLMKVSCKYNELSSIDIIISAKSTHHFKISLQIIGLKHIHLFHATPNEQ